MGTLSNKEEFNPRCKCGCTDKRSSPTPACFVWTCIVLICVLRWSASDARREIVGPRRVVLRRIRRQPHEPRPHNHVASEQTSGQWCAGAATATALAVVAARWAVTAPAATATAAAAAAAIATTTTTTTTTTITTATTAANGGVTSAHELRNLRCHAAGHHHVVRILDAQNLPA